MSARNFDWTDPFWGLTHAERNGRKATVNSYFPFFTEVSLYRRTPGGSVEMVLERTCRGEEHREAAMALANRYLAGGVEEDPFAGDTKAPAGPYPVEWVDDSDPEAGS